MTSSLLNFVFENFLSSIVEIDTSKTNVSILSGDIELNNLKIKDEIFQNLNLPFIEVVHGYVGALHISLKMPFFYDHTITVFVDKIFFHARLKNINKLDKDEEIKNMQEFKKNQLLKTEQIKAQVEEVRRQNEENESKKSKDEKKSPGLVQKIINNLKVEINDIVFKFDDEISYPDVPYSIGIILDSINIRSTRSDFKIPQNPEEVIPYEEINFKVVEVDNFSIYMDCFDSKEELDFEKLISNKVTPKIKVELRTYLKDQLGFYSYCMSEVYVHSRKFDSHQYLLHQLDLSVKVALNDNAQNKEPKISAKVGFPQILLGISLKQIRTLLKVIAYVNLNTLYQKGISREYYNKELNQNEKRAYIDGYSIYFQKKYIEKEKIDFPLSLEQMEEHMNYEQISELRSTALEKLEYINRINELTKRIEKEENRFFGRKEEIIQKLNEERNKVMRMEEEFNKGHREEIENIVELEEDDEFKGLEDTYVKIYALVDILITSFTIYETVIRKADYTWELKDKLLSIVIQHFGVECKIQKVGLITLLSLENIIISQEKIKNPNYNKIFFGDLTIKGKILCIIFEMNPKLKKSDMRVKIWSERQVYIIADAYTLQYIQYQIMDVLSTTIDLEEASSYAKGTVYNYIQEGYHDKVLVGKFTHTNLYLDVSLNCPIIIIPIDVFDYNNTNCILLSLGSLNLKSILPPRVDNKLNYEQVKDESIMYDIYRIGLLGIKMATVENCVEKNNYIGRETPLLKEFDFSIECKLLIQPKNPYFNNMIINLLIPELDFQLTEFQILLMIEFLGNITNEGNKLQHEMNLLKRQERRNRIEMIKRQEQIKLLQLTEEEKKEQEKEREEKIKKKQEEIKKQRLEASIKRAKVVYDKVIKSFGMSDHSRANYELIQVKKGKKAIVVNFIIKKTRFAIRKMFADLSIEDYLVFQIDIMKIGVDIMENGIMLISYIIKHISLYDLDKDERKQYYLNQNYLCLVESSKEGEAQNLNQALKSKVCFIDLNMLMLGEEMDMIINMNDLNIIISLDSLIRLYQFGMYYLDVFTTTMFNVESEKYILQQQLNKKMIESGSTEEIKEKNNELIQNDINKEYMARLKKYVRKHYTVEQAKDFIKKRHKKKTLDDYIAYFADVESSAKGKKVFVTTERNRSKMRLIFNMNNTMFKLPLDPTKLDEPLFSMYFSLTYTMDAANVYDNIIALPSKKLLAQIYETKTSFMHVSLSEFEFDMVYFLPNTKNFTHNPSSERLVSNFRFSCSIEGYIVPLSEVSVMKIDVEMEPLILAFGMRQVRKLMKLSDLSLAILPKFEEKYIPHIKPEQVINGVAYIPKRRKMHMKEVIRRILTRNQFKRILKQKMTEVMEKEKEKKKVVFINTNRFNSHMEINVKINKIALILFDNTVASKTIMLEINLTKLMVVMKTNTRIKDKDNMSLALYEMLTAEQIPRTKFNLNHLGLYLDVLFSLDSNYFNININEFEPLLERFNMGVTMLQVAPFCKSKCYVTTNDIINFNLSTDGVIALNKFLLTFMQDEKMWDQDMAYIYAPMMSRLSIVNGRQSQKDMGKEIILKFLNLTGLDLVFYFDDNPNYKIPMKQNGKINFSRAELYKARGHDRYKNPYQKSTFSLTIRDSKPIENINFQRNNFKQFKVNAQSSDGKVYPIYFSVKVESSGITNTVTICPSISFYNDTLYDTIFLSVNSQNIPENNIIIPKGKSEYIPLSWIMCDSPESNVSMKLSQNGQYTQICNNISEFVVDPIVNEHIISKRESQKNKVQKDFPDANNPTFIKMIDIKKSEFDNRKDSKSCVFNDNGARRCINFDYFILQSKEFKKNNELNKENKEINSNNNVDDVNNSISEMYPKYSQSPYWNYEYIIYVRPLLTIINKIPFTMNLSCSEGNKIVETLEKDSFYDQINDMKLTLEYNNYIYTSNLFSLNEENQYIDLTSPSLKNSIKCHVFRNPVKLTIPNPQKFYCDLKDYSINCYEYTFFFDYLFNNRLTKKIWVCPCDKKGLTKLKEYQINPKVLECKESSINLLSLPDYEPNISIKDENSPWSESFNINTIGVQGCIKLDSTNFPVAPGMKEQSKYSGGGGLFQSTNEIACLLSGSDFYDFSVIVIFEPKYIIINNLGFDIVYKQETYSNIYPLKSKNYHGLMYEKGEKDFRIGIKDDSSQVINYSEIFNLENVQDVDLKIKINKDSPMFNREMKIFSYDGVTYNLLIRVINQTYDQGTVFILLTHPIYPYLEISNLTNAPLRVYEEGTRGIIINSMKAAVPFTWENSNKHKDKIFFEIYGKTSSFNYSIFKEEVLKINERAITLLYSVSSKHKTATRRFEIKEKESLTKLEADELKLYLRDKSRPKSSYNDIFIRGFGISIIDNTPQELFYLSAYNISVKFISNVLLSNGGAKTESTINIIVYIDNMQIDYCLNDSLKTILSPKVQIVPSIEADVRNQAKVNNEQLVPFMSVLVTMTTKVNLVKEEQFTSYDQIDFVLQEFDIKVEQYALMNLLKLSMEMLNAFDYAKNIQKKVDKEPLLDIEMHIPLKKLLNENENSVMQLIYYLLFGALKFNLTLRLDLSNIPLGLPKTAKRVIGAIGNTMGRITDCPLRFNEKIIENVYLSWADISMIIVNSYITQGITQIYKVLGSLDIIGNPVKLVRNVGGGFYDFVNEPRKGFRNGPKEFGIGVAKGFGGLVYGIFGGIFDFIQRISGTLYAATQSLTGTDRDSMSIEDENEPQNILSGIGQGVVGFGKEIGKGFYGFCAEPCNKAGQQGAGGLCKGLCSGLLKLVLCPFAGLLKFITCVMAGCKNSCYVLTGKKKLRTTRFRHPRVIVEGDKKLLPYEENKAEAREALYQLEKVDTNNILFSEDFICPDCPRKLSTAILTDKFMYVIYNLQKIVFKLDLKHVSNTSLHYLDDKFIMVFTLKDNITKKGFPIRYDYSTVGTGLQDILYYMFNKSQIMNAPDGQQGPNLIYDNIVKDDLIDKSSYANTLIGEQSVYSDKTLASKITIQYNKLQKTNTLLSRNNTFENDSIKQLNPRLKNSDYVALNVK